MVEAASGPAAKPEGPFQDLQTLDVVGGQEGGFGLAHSIDHHQAVAEGIEPADHEQIEDAEAGQDVDRRGSSQTVRQLTRAHLFQVSIRDHAQRQGRLLEVDLATEQAQGDRFVVGGCFNLDRGAGAKGGGGGRGRGRGSLGRVLSRCRRRRENQQGQGDRSGSHSSRYYSLGFDSPAEPPEPASALAGQGFSRLTVARAITAMLFFRSSMLTHSSGW